MNYNTTCGKSSLIHYYIRMSSYFSLDLRKGYFHMMNASQYEFDVDVDAPVGTVLFTVLISAEDPNFAKHFSLHIQEEFLTISFNEDGRLQTIYYYFSTNVKNDFEYDNDTMLYTMPVNIVLHMPFDPNDNLTTHQTQLELYYRDNNFVSRETADIILHIKGKPSLMCFIRSFGHLTPAVLVITTKFL